MQMPSNAFPTLAAYFYSTALLEFWKQTALQPEAHDLILYLVLTRLSQAIARSSCWEVCQQSHGTGLLSNEISNQFCLTWGVPTHEQLQY